MLGRTELSHCLLTAHQALSTFLNSSWHGGPLLWRSHIIIGILTFNTQRCPLLWRSHVSHAVLPTPLALSHITRSAAHSFGALTFNTQRCPLLWRYLCLSSGVLIIVTGLAFIGSYQAKNTRRDTAFRHMWSSLGKVIDKGASCHGFRGLQFSTKRYVSQGQ